MDAISTARQFILDNPWAVVAIVIVVIVLMRGIAARAPARPPHQSLYRRAQGRVGGARFTADRPPGPPADDPDLDRACGCGHLGDHAEPGIGPQTVPFPHQLPRRRTS